MVESNRAILLTSPGAAAIAVVRIVGPSVPDFLAKHFSRAARPMRCVHGELRDAGGRVIDDPVVVLHENHAAADINLHGGPWVVQACLELARASGFELIDRLAAPLAPAPLPGAPLPDTPLPTTPLPDEAIDAIDVADPIERAMLASLPLATTEPALRALLAQPDAWRAFLGSNPPAEAIKSMLDDRALWWLLHPPRVAIVGAPNVGKSMLANQLFAQPRSITADLPGTTRDWVGELANLDGLAVHLVDTPGVRETADSIERAAIDRSRAEVTAAHLVVIVLDATRRLEDQSDLLRAYPDAIRVANKIDRPHAWDARANADIQTVATTGLGIDDLRSAIRKRFGCENLDPQRARWWSDDQRAWLRRRVETSAS